MLRGDCHTHSDCSDGGSPIEEMALTARDLGHEYLVLTDHSPRLTVADGLSDERLRQPVRLDEPVVDLRHTRIPQLAVNDWPGSRRIRPSPDWKLLAGQVIGSTANPRRARSARCVSPL
jgi:hypothetical protein